MKKADAEGEIRALMHVWRDTQWPEASAHVQQCDLNIYAQKPESYRIDCAVSFAARGQQIVSHVFSRSTPAPRRVIWQYPPHQYDSMQQWVDAHPQGTPIAVHYDPRKPRQGSSGCHRHASRRTDYAGQPEAACSLRGQFRAASHYRALDPPATHRGE